MTISKPNQRLRLRVTAAAERELRAGHPWVFSDSVREQNREGEAGELAVIYDRQDSFLAIGLFDPDSPIRVRVLNAGKPQTIDAAWWSARLAQAVERRRGLFDEQTNGYRVINGESDGWPGLVLDRYDTTLVLKIYTAAWLPRLEEVAELIEAQLKPQLLVLRLSRHVERRAAARRDGEVLFSQPAGASPSPDSVADTPPGAPVTFLESGLRFEADVIRGQKTGFFLDQRENRRRVESMARGRTVLNTFSFSGGFSLYAARGGAKSVTDLDISTHALGSAKRNFQLNEASAEVARTRHESVQADAFEWLDSTKGKFDLIILDPPSFAKREVERAEAIRAYGRLVSAGLDHLNAGGIVVACSCSAHVSSEEFFDAVTRSATASTRRFVELERAGHAPDHPAAFREAEYLKAIYLRF